LVTLSSYGAKLDSLFMFTDDYRNKYHNDERRLIGMIVQISVPKNPFNQHLSENEKHHYHIKWFKEASPKGRHGNYGFNYFYRKDLKYISKST